MTESYSQREFAWEMRRTKPGEWSRNPAMMQYANMLTQEFSKPSIEAVRKDRQGLGDYAEYISATVGLNAALSLLREYESVGLPSAIQAVITTRITRSADEFAVCVQQLKRLYNKSNGDLYVGQFYASALAAIGKLEELSELASEVAPQLLVEPNQRNIERWIELLVDMLVLHVPKQILSEAITQNAWTKRTLERIQSYETATANVGDVLQTTVINLPAETRKYQLAERLLSSAGHRVARLDAVIGARLPEVTVSTLCGSPRVRQLMSPGSVAASLSHFKAWETFLESTEELCLIAEDDAGPYFHSSHLADVVDAMGESEIVFVNERMSSLSMDHAPEYSSILLDPWEQTAGWASGRQGWGFDGYILTRRGAEKCISLASRLGIMGHVDGQFGAYATNPQGEPTNGIQSNIIEFRRKIRDEESLTGSCASLPGIKANTFGVSSTVTAGMR